MENRSTWDGELFTEMGIQGARFGLCDGIWSGYRLHSHSITSSLKMHDASVQYRRRVFRKVMGRDFRGLDNYISQGYKLLRHLLNMRDTLQRVFKGPIYGRKV